MKPSEYAADIPVPDWAYAIADAVMEMLGPIPDRSFMDDQGRTWQWCGGQPGTWAWRITDLGIAHV
jgi:hypothetical protein